MITGNEPATATDFLNPKTGNVEFAVGLTIRQYYAGLAMQGLLLGAKVFQNGDDHSGMYAKEAVVMADALINELNKER